jgi:hypothetical protein
MGFPCYRNFYLLYGNKNIKIDRLLREHLKTSKSRLATEAKVEFTEVNEHFADRMRINKLNKVELCPTNIFVFNTLEKGN